MSILNISEELLCNNCKNILELYGITENGSLKYSCSKCFKKYIVYQEKGIVIKCLA